MNQQTKMSRLRSGEWFRLHGDVYQKLNQLNGSNAYKLNDPTLGYIHPETVVEQTYPPTHHSVVRNETIVIHHDGTWHPYMG
jgi:hypothetical protein